MKEDLSVLGFQIFDFFHDEIKISQFNIIFLSKFRICITKSSNKSKQKSLSPGKLGTPFWTLWVTLQKAFLDFTPTNQGMNYKMSPNQAIFSTSIVISYLLVFIKKYIPGSIVYFVLFWINISEKLQEHIQKIVVKLINRYRLL